MAGLLVHMALDGKCAVAYGLMADLPGHMA
jgi:hypothetical protein